MEQQLPVSEVQQPAPKKKISLGNRWIVIASLLIVVLAIAATGYLGQRLYVNQQQLKRVEHTVVDMRTGMTQQQTSLQSTQKQIQVLQQQSQRDGWVLIEVNYLVEQAIFKLKFDHDAELAMQFLQLADQRVQAGSSALLPLRQALAQDLMALNAAPKVDVPGLVLRLNALSQQINSLPQVPSAPPKALPTKPASTPAVSTGQAVWDKAKLFVFNAGEAIKGMIVITHSNDKFVPFLLTNEQRAAVVMNIQAQLTLAQWAVIHRQTDVYQQSLQQAADWLNMYFFRQSPAVTAVLDTMQQLKSTVVNPVLPEVSHSLVVLEKLQQAITVAVEK